MRKKEIDPIPESFDSLEEAGEFWDEHDTSDYPNMTQAIVASTQLRKRYYEVEVDMELGKALRNKARKRGMTPGDLASEVLRQQLAA